ncbi:hypothetical protein FG379_001751 [Cryptosporidium bovis]|uniref:uncharacterized protein n=1 Tax=Cryptosporidium bovis TaxID=310047 RepID=UPI00351A56C6|nr:hypothetical protein FG379_001751 [Cryptosporidium bovis]
MDKFTTKQNRGNEISKERYVYALKLERSRRLEVISEKAEKLRRLYKTRLEEDLRSFVIVHGDKKSKSPHCSLESKNNFNNHIEKLSYRNKLESNNENSKLEINASLMPALAWPASLRTRGKFNMCSLFYTLETCIPLSTLQIGGSTITKVEQKVDKIEGRKITQGSSYKNTGNKKTADTITRKEQANPVSYSNSSLISGKRQKLFAKYGPPFTWTKSQTKATICQKSPSVNSALSTPKSHLFTEIPKQPSIYPLEFQVENNVAGNNNVNEFIRKTLRMQKMLEVLIEDN